MFFYVDESGHTGSNLFDKDQPVLYYGVLSSKLDVDDLASDAMEVVRDFLGVKRLHATELGVGKLARISEGLILLQDAFRLRFDFYMVHKLDHAAIYFLTRYLTKE